MKRLLILLVLISSAVQAEIYKSQNEKGEWIYSDKRSPRAELLKLPPLSTYAPPVQSQPEPDEQEESGEIYKSMEFIEPKNKLTLRGHDEVVNASVRLVPLLKTQRGHKIQYYLDDKPLGEPVVSSKLTLKDLERGEHVLGAQVLDDNGVMVFSATPVTFYIRRDSALNPNNLNNPDNPKSLRNPDNILNNPNNPYHIKNNPNAPGPINPNPPKPPKPPIP